MWIDFPNFATFTDGTVRNAIEICGSSFEDISKFSLPNFIDGDTKLAGFKNVGKSFIKCDGIKWYQKKKGKKEVKPRTRKLEVNGSTLKIYNCNLPEVDSLKKYAIHNPSKNTCIMIYVTDGSVVDFGSLVESKSKLNDNQIKAVRSALDGRSIKYAFKLLSDAQVGVTLKQVTNQARSVPSTIKKKRGKRPVTNPSDFVELTRIHRSAQFYSEKSDFRFMYINDNLMSLFVNSLPSKKRLGKIRLKMDGSEEWSTEEVNEYIESNKEYSVKGSDKRLPHLEVDTTFDLSSCYVTILSGTLPNFVTRSSDKMRHVSIGFMIHNSKNAHHHAAFSSFILEKMEKSDPKFKKRVPSIIHDGEASFSNYHKGIHFESALLCRCDLHRRSNIEKFVGSKVSESDMKKLFGKTDAERFLKRGIFGALSMEDFEYRLEKSTVDDKIKKWIGCKKEELFDSHSLKTKLLAGFYTQNVTSNQIECINSKIKTTIIQRPENGKTCAARLIDYLAEEVRSLYRSAMEGDDSYIVCTAFDPSHSSFSIKQNIDFLAKVGFEDCLVPILNIPSTLKTLIPTTNANDILSLEVISRTESFLVQKNPQARAFVEVVVKNELIECRNPGCLKQFPEICSHIVAVLLNSEVHQRENYLSALVAKVSEVTIRQSERAQERRGQAKRFKRKFTEFSRTNHDRGLTGVHPDTPNSTIQTVRIDTETENPEDRTISPMFLWNTGLNSDESLNVHNKQTQDSDDKELNRTTNGSNTGLNSDSSLTVDNETTQDSDDKKPDFNGSLASDEELVEYDKRFSKNGKKWVSTSDEEDIFGGNYMGKKVLKKKTHKTSSKTTDEFGGPPPKIKRLSGSNDSVADVHVVATTRKSPRMRKQRRTFSPPVQVC